MVIPDLNTQKPDDFNSAVSDVYDSSAGLAEDEKFRIASPADRFASVVIDYFIILLPIIYLVLAPYQRMVKEAAILENDATSSVAILMGSLSVFVLIIFYQLASYYFWRGTPGQILMGLRIKSLWENSQLNLAHVFLRSIFWVISVLSLCIPFLSIFSNAKRRALHDRISDSIVVSVRSEKKSSVPTPQEYYAARGLYWSINSLFILMLLAAISQYLSSLENQDRYIAALEEEDRVCAEVSDAVADWPDKSSPEAAETRLAVAMALYAATTIDKKCLEAEVEELFSVNDESLLLTLARSFAYSDSLERSDMYLDQICKKNPESSECLFSQVISSLSRKDWVGVDYQFSEIEKHLILERQNNKYKSSYMAVWGVRQFVNKEDWGRAEKFMQYVPQIQNLADFTFAARAKIDWGSEKFEEALGIESVAYAAVGDLAKLEISSFLCFEQIWNTCEHAQSASCNQLSKMVDEFNDGLSYLETSIAYLRLHECRANKNSKLNYHELTALPVHEDVQSLVSALEEEGTEGFTDLKQNSQSNEVLLEEVARRLAERTTSKGLLKALFGEWEKSPPTLASKKTGETLSNRMLDLKEYEAALRTVEKMISRGQNPSVGTLKRSVVVAYELGQVGRAHALFKVFLNKYPLFDKRELRAPASRESSSDVIFRKLLKESL